MEDSTLTAQNGREIGQRIEKILKNRTFTVTYRHRSLEGSKQDNPEVVDEYRGQRLSAIRFNDKETWSGVRHQLSSSSLDCGTRNENNVSY